MPRIALTAFALSLAGLSLSLGAPAPMKKPATLGELIKSRGLPPYSARSVRFENDRLDVSGSDSVDRRGHQRLRGRTLLYCDRSDTLVLGLAVIAWKMKRAAPTVGREAPGTDLEQLLQENRPLLAPLTRPVPITLVTVDDRGVVRRTQTARVTQLRFLP
jgi:hypothetical protein